MPTFESIRELALEAGFHLHTALTREDALHVLAAQVPHLAAWQGAGHAGEMRFMQRPVELFTQLDHLLPNCQALLVFAVPYSDGAKSEPAPYGFGRIARYARGRDYHLVLRERLGELCERLVHAGLLTTAQYRVFSDSVPLLERALASHGQLGFVGRHSLLIREGLGTYFFLAELLVACEITGLPTRSPQATLASTPRAQRLLPLVSPGTGCGRCHSCISQCPTNAIVSDGVVSSPRCISYLTIEKREQFSREESELIGDWLFGCDICQEVCPFNTAADQNDLFPAFLPQREVHLSLLEIFALRTTADFRRAFRESAILRTRREGLLRNALAVAWNTRCFPMLDSILELASSDESPLIRAQARATLGYFQPLTDGLDKRKITEFLSGDEPCEA